MKKIFVSVTKFEFQQKNAHELNSRSVTKFEFSNFQLFFLDLHDLYFMLPDGFGM